MTASPHHIVRDDWLALTQEDVLAPGHPIFDCHHHLWDRPEGRYGAAELMADVSAGHDVRASLYVQCRTGYRAYGPKTLLPVGEVETVLDWTRGQDRFPAGIGRMHIRSCSCIRRRCFMVSRRLHLATVTCR